ncbi:ph domain containing protein [Stylonychia lemnae]|uniref:Ph domain containing protein n=1 Tax=Stylonychia lemnae TaxID=5949 RepID=A0A078A1D1_STYLE|nr:ph domain containing protein [Stylonychia lemnae]|eukprot:CDW76061.1 ph domain containing protein [Stylonychia lemnae]
MSGVNKNHDKKYIDYQQSMLKFIPVSVVQYLLSKQQDERSLPQCQHYKTAIIVAEIKNFYDQSHRHKFFNSDQSYNEHLANLSNRFLEIMSKAIHKYGGDIVQFIGNSMIALWPRADPLGESTFEGKEDDETDANIARKATQCALDIKNESQKIISQRTEIFMGLGFGHCGILHVGGVFKRAEYFIIGDGLSQALRSLRLTKSSDSVIISQNMWRVVDKYFVCEPLPQSFENEKSVKYLFGPGIRSKSNTIVLRSEFEPYLKLKRDTFGNEHRRITAMVLNLEIEDMYQRESFTIIQKIVEIVQQQIYKLEGSFNKIISYDGGFTMLCTWGISPISHEDDATRAVYTAQNVQREIKEFASKAGLVDFSPPIHIGICTGNVFMGIVGNEGSRKEIVILGEPIERAFLYMQTASKHYGKIYVDYDTKLEASLFVDFRYVEHIEFAHKLTNCSIFEPQDALQNQNDKYFVDEVGKYYRNEYQHKFSQIYGQNDVISLILDDISIYAASPEDSVWVLGIKGEPGSGKSLFARNLIQKVIAQEKSILKVRNENYIDAAEGSGFPKVAIVESIFGIKGLQRNGTQSVIFESQQNNNQSYPQNIEEDILFFLHEFIYEVILKLKDDILFFIVMDNVSLMDRGSWRLFDLITSDTDNLIIIMCIQNQSIDNLTRFNYSPNLQMKISDEAQQLYKERIAEYEREIFNVVEMEPITPFDLRQILIDLAEQYERDMKDEIYLMTQIIDSNNSIKTYHGQLEIKNKMIKKYQVYDFFKEVEKEVIVEVVKKCQGNPLLCISLVFQLLTNDFINVKEQILLSTNKSAYQLMKAASIYGERFSMNQVKEIFIFDDQNVYHLELLFRVLENRKLIELVYIDQKGDREGQRKQIHQKINAYLQENMIYNWQTDNLMAEEGVNNERILSLRARQALVIKKVNACIMQKSNYVKKGGLILEKAATNNSQRYVKLTVKGFTWFKNKIEFERNLEQGSVALDQILKINVLKNPYAQSQQKNPKNLQQSQNNISLTQDPLNNSNINNTIIDTSKKAQLYTFQLICNEWSKNGFVNQQQKTLTFIAGTRRDGEDWVAHIEYLRTKANVDQFMNKFGKVKFPVTSQFDNNSDSQFKINQKPDYKFGSEFTRSVYGNLQRQQQLNTQASQRQLQYSLSSKQFKRKSLRKTMGIELVNEDENNDTVHNLKCELQALFNIVSLQFVGHMQKNACKFNEEHQQDESCELNVISDKQLVNEIIEEMPIIERIENIEDQSNNIMNQIRRGTLFNHIISDSSNPNLKTIGGRMQFGFHRLSTIKRKSNINFSQLERIAAEVQNQKHDQEIHETISYNDDDSLDTVKDQLFDEYCPYREIKVALPLRDFPYYEGSQVVQYLSIKNDIKKDFNNSRLKRRRKPRLQKFQSIENQDGEDQNSIKKQQQRKPDPAMQKKTQAMTKILNQTHKTKASRIRDEIKNAEIQAIQQLQKQHQEERQKEKERRQMQNKVTEYGSQNILRSQYSVSQLQTLKEVDRQKIPKLKHKDSTFSKKSQRGTENNRKIFKPTPSERQLNWIERDESVRKISEYRNLEDESANDDDNHNQDSCNINESLPAYDSKMTRDKKNKVSESNFKRSPSRKAKDGQQATMNSNQLNQQQNNQSIQLLGVINQENVTWIPQDQNIKIDPKQYKLNKGDIIEIVNQIKELGIVLCAFKLNFQKMHVFVKRDMIDIYNQNGMVNTTMNSMINNLSAIKEFSTSMEQPSKIMNNNLTKSMANDQSLISSNMIQLEKQLSKRSDHNVVQSQNRNQQQSHQQQILHNFETFNNYPVQDQLRQDEKIKIIHNQENDKVIKTEQSSDSLKSNQDGALKKDGLLKLQERRKKKLEQAVAEQALKNTIQEEVQNNIVANAQNQNLKMLERKKKRQQDKSISDNAPIDERLSTQENPNSLDNQ